MDRVIITGASEGLGAEIAKLLAERGTEVVCLSRNAPAEHVVHIPTDLADKESIENAVKVIREQFATFSCLINCAGIMSIALPEALDYEETERLFRINVLAPLMLASGLMDLIKTNGADIVNVGSTVGFKAYESQAAYGASKWALRGVNENLRLELKKTPCRVIGFNPGGFKSRILEKATGRSGDLSAYMDPCDIAKFLVNILDLPKNMEVSDVTINRKV
jgi:uncharacterized protein